MYRAFFTHHESSFFFFSLLSTCEVHRMCQKLSQALQVLTQQMKPQAPMEASRRGTSLCGSGRASQWKLQRKQRPEDKQAMVRTKESSRQKDQQVVKNSSSFSQLRKRGKRIGERCRGRQALGLESHMKKQAPSLGFTQKDYMEAEKV